MFALRVIQGSEHVPLPPPPLPLLPPPEAAPTPNTVAIASVESPTVGTAVAAVTGALSTGRYLEFSTGIETDIEGKP